MQVDKDGKKTVFGIKTVTVNKSVLRLSVFPNPVTSTQVKIILDKPTFKSLNVQLLNSIGNVVYRGAFAPQSNSLFVTLPSKPAAGIYLLKVEGFAPFKLIVN